MKRWFAAWIAVALACVPILLHRATSQDLLRDTDTKVLLITLRQRHAPFSWFGGDWPLANHFYRPVSTLAFELDNRLYGNNAAGYGLTNALLCVVCVLLLFWFLRELTDRPLLAAAGGILFAFQHVGYEWFITTPLYWLGWATLVAGAIRHRQRISNWLPACLVLLYCLSEVASLNGFSAMTVGWLPGRTATVMAVFALTSMAAYARYERLGADRPLPSPSPLDAPATRSTSKRGLKRKPTLLLPVLSLVAAWLALASYEQAVMLPAVMLAVACTMRFNRYRVRWGWHGGFWALLLVYLFLRRELLPAGASGYQLQQFRHGPGVYISLLNYALPIANGFTGFWVEIQTSWLTLMTASPYNFALALASNLTTFYQARRHWVFALAGYGMSLIAFLPMAWVKPFAHYHYWPMALRSLFTVSLLWVAFDLCVIAWSPPALQAPPRPDPAPGSLPRP